MGQSNPRTAERVKGRERERDGVREGGMEGWREGGGVDDWREGGWSQRREAEDSPLLHRDRKSVV